MDLQDNNQHFTSCMLNDRSILIRTFEGPDLLSACVSANPHLVLKNYCQDWLKTQWEISAEKVWTAIFVTYLTEYAFVGVSLSIGKFIGGEYLDE